MQSFPHTRGATLLETLIAAFIVVVAFVGIVGLLQLGGKVTFHNKARIAALQLAQERMEYLRSLAYDELGTVGGVPAGSLAPTSTTTLNRIPFTIRTDIRYIDAPQDGLADQDQNGIITDYKQARVEVRWGTETPHRVALVSSFAPPHVESGAGGGTLSFAVFDASVQPVPQAAVHIQNNTVNPPINTTIYTNDQGKAQLVGAPPATDYAITVTKNGYSTDATYSVTAENPSPDPGHLTVATSTVTSKNFFIDLLSSLTIKTQKPPEVRSWAETFDDPQTLATSSQVSITGGLVTLAQSGGAYVSEGFVQTTQLQPAYLRRWDMLSGTFTTSTGTSVTFQILDQSGTPLPDTVIPGNSTGLQQLPADLSGISTSTYPSLAVRATLTSTNTSTTPTLDTLQISYQAGPFPLPYLSFSIRGEKTIGSNAGAPVYKFQQSTSTDASAQVLFPALEWDTYHITNASSSWAIKQACPMLPLALKPNTSTTTVLTLVPRQNNTLRISVTDTTGTPVTDATVTLNSTNATTDSCGQAFFNNLAAGNNYTLTITKTGYQTIQEQNISVSGETTRSYILQSIP